VQPLEFQPQSDVSQSFQKRDACHVGSMSCLHRFNPCHGSNSPAPAIATAIGRSVCSTLTVPVPSSSLET
jgi:hypothetical protein